MEVNIQQKWLENHLLLFAEKNLVKVANDYNNNNICYYYLTMILPREYTIRSDNLSFGSKIHFTRKKPS